MLDELIKEAEALGLSIDGRWSEETLRQKIEEAKDAQGSSSQIGTSNASGLSSGDLVPASNTSDPALDAEQTTPVRLLYDWWDGQGIRREQGQTLDVPLTEAIKLIGEGKAQRADPLPGQR